MQKITSLQHPIVKHLTHLRQNRDYRYEHSKIVLPGVKLVEELKNSPIVTMAATEEYLALHPAKSDQVFQVTEEILHKITGLPNPEGVVVEINMPKPASLQGISSLLVLDGINDPGNLGTLLRTAFAFGWQGAFLLDNCCDPYNDKAIRAARGATFKLPLAQGSWQELENIKKLNSLVSLAADLEGEAPEGVQAQKPMLILGNEARGLSAQSEAASQKVSLPMAGNMESLNVAVAGGILLYLLRPKRGAHG